jgi:DNA-binding MarR family transcriptional regulator
MTKTVRILEAAGFVTRERDATDARVVRIRATRRAKELVLRGRDDRVIRIGRALAAFSPTETARLAAAIGTLERLVRDLEAAAMRRSAGSTRERPTPTRSSRSRRAPVAGTPASRAR